MRIFRVFNTLFKIAVIPVNYRGQSVLIGELACVKYYYYLVYFTQLTINMNTKVCLSKLFCNLFLQDTYAK